MILERYHRYFRASQDQWERAEGRELVLQKLSHPELLDLLNVRYLVSRAPIDWPDRFALRHTAADGTKVYENKLVMPAAYAIGQARYVDAVACLKSLASEDFNMREVALVEDQADAFAGASFFEPCQVLERRSDRIVIQAVLPHDGLLISSEVYYPGWQATVDGDPVEVIRCNYLFRGVRVPAGSHEITFELRPKSLIVGGWISLFGWGVAGVCLFLPIGSRVVAESAPLYSRDA